MAGEWPVFQADDFDPVRLAGRGFPELFSLGHLLSGEHRTAAVCPIFWEESVFIGGERATSTACARFLEGVALQIFSQAPERVKVIVYDCSFEFNTPALEAVSEIIKAHSEESAIVLVKSQKDFERAFKRLMEAFSERKSRLAMEGKNNWREIMQSDDLSDMFLLVVRGAHDLCEMPAFERLPEFLRHAPRMGILCWIDGTSKPDVDESYWKKRKQAWDESLRAACPIHFDLAEEGLSPARNLADLQPFSTYRELGLIQPFMMGVDALDGYVKLTRERFAIKKEQQQKDFISVEIGKKNGQPFFLGIGPASDVYHSILAGVTGSGKTAFLKHFVALVCEKYTANDVLIQLYDFKRGASLDCYRGIPNFEKNLHECIDAPEKAMEALDAFVEEAHRRQDIFTRAQRQGMPGDSLAAYNRWLEKNGREEEKLPLKLMIIDELGQLYKDFGKNARKYQLRMDFSGKIDSVARQGRSQGMFLLLSSQHFDDIDIDDAITNCQLRMAMRLDSTRQCAKVFKSGNYAAYEQLKKVDPGSARDILINANAGREEANQIVRLPFISDESLQARLDALKTPGYSKPDVSPPVVEGKRSRSVSQAADGSKKKSDGKFSWES